MPTDAQAFRITEFCLRNSISTATFHKLKRKGLGPREMNIDGAIRISIEAEREWRAARENPTKAEAEQIARAAAARVEKSRRIGKIGAASPKHPCRRRASATT